MPTSEDIDQQKQQLAAHRRTLGHYLKQRAALGAQYTPPGVLNGIEDARVHVALCKGVLRDWGETVEDLPGDNASMVERVNSANTHLRSWFWLLGRRSVGIDDSEIDRRNRQVFINDMRRRYQEILESAPKIIRLRLAERAGAVEQPGALVRPYDIARRRPGQPDELLPARAKLLDLYDEHNAQLLILGAPGAGKTFLLYELARDQVERAANDESASVPVIFSLASWRPGQELAAWMIADLSRRYGAKQQVIARLIDSGAILPFFDGLDEVDTLERRKACVDAINIYRQSRELLPSLVVACREREYKDLPPLRLNTALVVQPLAPAQARRYLAGTTFEGLRAAIARDSGLADLARTPLLLGLMAETYRDRAPALPLAADDVTLRQVILSDYVTHCCAPRADAAALRVPEPRLRVFLAWLALGMIAHDNQQDFYLEFLQPSWLPTRRWRRVWRVLCFLVIGLVVGRVVGLVVGRVVGLEVGWALGLEVGLVSGLMVALTNEIQTDALPERTTVNQGIHRSLRNAGVAGVMGGVMGGLIGVMEFGLVAGLIAGLIAGLMKWLVIGLVLGLVFGLMEYGGSAVIQHYNLRILLSCCTPAPFNLTRWLEEARMRGLLVRVGGGYRFYHELLQRHFAAHDEPGYPRVPILAESESPFGDGCAPDS